MVVGLNPMKRSTAMKDFRIRRMQLMMIPYRCSPKELLYWEGFHHQTDAYMATQQISSTLETPNNTRLETQ